MTKQCIDKTISDIDYQKLFPHISSPANIWNMSDDEIDEEESSSNYYAEYSDNICFFVSKLCIEIEKHANADNTVTGCVLCVIPHIIEYVLKKSNRNHINQLNTVIKTLCAGSSEK